MLGAIEQMIAEDCVEFFRAGTKPLLRLGPLHGPDVMRVKVRYTSNRSKLAEAFRLALNSDVSILNRSVLGYTTLSDVPEDQEVYVLLPPNGYRTLSPRATTISNVVDLAETVSEQSTDIVADVIKSAFSRVGYTTETLIYNIPYYYAVKRDAYKLLERRILK